jgi:hypothetical protein
MTKLVLRLAAFLFGLSITLPAIAQIYEQNPIPIAPYKIIDNLTSPFTTDYATHTVYSQAAGNTANSIYRMTTAGFVNNYDVYRSVLTIPSGTTVTNSTGFASYLVNNAALGSGVNAASGVNFFSVGVAAVNNGAVWGLNPILTDNTSFTASSGTGRYLQNEFDFNVTSPSTVVHGLFVTGASLSQMAAGSDGFSCRTGNAGWTWPTCFQSVSGAAQNAFVAGATAVGQVNTPSQYMLYAFTDGTGAGQSYNMRVNATNQFELAASTGGLATYKFNGLIFTPDSSSFPNAFEAGAQAASGSNIASQSIYWHYFNAAGASALAQAQVTTGQVLSFSGVNGYQFDTSIKLTAGVFQIGSAVGATCSGPLTAGTVVITGGIVTHC